MSHTPEYFRTGSRLRQSGATTLEHATRGDTPSPRMAALTSLQVALYHSQNETRTQQQGRWASLLDLVGSVRFGVTILASILVWSWLGSAGTAPFGSWFIRKSVEKTEMEWFAWWPFQLLLALLVLSVVLVTFARFHCGSRKWGSGRSMPASSFSARAAGATSAANSKAISWSTGARRCCRPTADRKCACRCRKARPRGSRAPEATTR